jgi:signal transduction histidine kinase
MLYDLIVENRAHIINRTESRTRERTAENADAAMHEHGVPLFLNQLLEALSDARLPAADSERRIIDSAALHGRELLRNGFTIGQVVHGYGDVCQVVTELATTKQAAISNEDFRVFNRCLDDAIAGAVTAFGRKREWDLAYESTERLGVLAHELRNLVHTAILSFDLSKRGTGDAAGLARVHSRSLSGLRALVDRSVAEVRMSALGPTMTLFAVAEFVEEMRALGAIHADAFELELVVGSIDASVMARGDQQLLGSAVSNLLLNAFKYTRGKGHRVSFTPRVTRDSVLFEIADECGGLPPGKAEELFRPFVRATLDESGLGLGLTIALDAVRANGGDISVRDVPGKGCVFTIDLPRRDTPTTVPPPPRERRETPNGVGTIESASV